MCFLAAARWAGRCAERRVAWPWRRRRSFFSVSYCVDKTLNSVNVCLERPVFNALGAAMCCPHRVARRWAGRCTERRIAWPWRRGHCIFLGVVSCWQNVKICECLLEMPNFQCIGAGSVPLPITCRTLGRAACAERPIAWPWRRRQSKFFVSYRVGKMLISVSVFLKCVVSLHW